MNSDWHFGVNDPDLFGWLTCIAYLLVAVLCWMCARKATGTSDANSTGDRFLWSGLAALMLVLGINKQLDLQTPFIALGRSLAITEGWYSQRRIVQWVFIGGLGSVGVAFLGLTAWRIRHAWFRHVLSLCGLAILITFVVLEAAPIHLTDVVDMSIPISNKRQILEVFGISCFGLSAIMNLRR